MWEFSTRHGYVPLEYSQVPLLSQLAICKKIYWKNGWAAQDWRPDPTVHGCKPIVILQKISYESPLEGHWVLVLGTQVHTETFLDGNVSAV